jgi:hypothetical protein
MNNIGPTYKTTQHHNQRDLKAKGHTSKSEQTVTLFLECFLKGNICNYINAAFCDFLLQ